MKNGRLFELLYLLVERRALTAGELAERFEVSERTIYRDVDAFAAAGVPVYTQRGTRGAACRLDGCRFVLDRCLLSPREQDEVLFALRALLSTGGLEGAEALERLSALFRREAEGWVEVDFTDWGSGEQERENFRIVREGILGRRLLDFTYYASSGTRTRRRVEPGKLVFKSGCWYLQAFCLARRDWRIFPTCADGGAVSGTGGLSSQTAAGAAGGSFPGTAAEWDPDPPFCPLRSLAGAGLFCPGPDPGGRGRLPAGGV